MLEKADMLEVNCAFHIMIQGFFERYRLYWITAREKAKNLSESGRKNEQRHDVPYCKATWSNWKNPTN
jgi:hypothetical protein